MVADIVAVETCTVDVKDGLYELGRFLRHRVDVELHEQVLGIVAPHVAHGQIDKEVVVGLSPLQVCLAAGDIVHQILRVAPDTVCGTHIDRGVELPSWPWVVFWRIACAVEESVVDSCTEHQVEIGFHLTE